MNIVGIDNAGDKRTEGGKQKKRKKGNKVPMQ
jgi:hypothetical protein